MSIKVVHTSITLNELKKIGEVFYDGMIKGVVDVKKEAVAFGGEYHMDANLFLLNEGSIQNDVWGFNIYFDKPKNSWIEYVSLINVRPALGSYDMEIKDNKLRERMKEIINAKIK